jgi:peptidyl-prolyl cis-trans isomerase B (cyclophilin B)
MRNPISTIEMSSGNKIVIELFPEHAPNAVNSYIWLAQRGKFDNREICRVVPGFVIQPSYSNFDDEEMAYLLEGEFASNGFTKGLKNDVGCVAMGGDGTRYASGSCFYFTLAYHERLDGNYTVFGKVIEGWDEVKRIEGVALEPVHIDVPGVTVNKPLKHEIMVKVTVNTFGITYPEPIKVAK